MSSVGKSRKAVVRGAAWVVALAVGAWSQFVSADVTPNSLEPPILAATCPTELPPGNPGDYAGVPGGWRNFKRYGTNWSFNSATQPGGNRIMVATWHTFHPQGGRPVWLTTEASSFTTEQNGERRWQSPLYEISLDPITLARDGIEVGSVSIVFPAGTATRAAIRWQWDAIDQSVHDECLYNFFREPNPYNAPNVAGNVNESYTANWYEPATSGWGIDFEVGVDLSGNYTEVGFADIFDSQGKAMWLYSQNDASAWRPLSWQDSGLGYYRGKYNITQDCSTDAECRELTLLAAPTHRFGRQFFGDNPSSATFAVKASGSVTSQNVTQSFAWPYSSFQTLTPTPPGCPFPGSDTKPCRNTQRLTDGDQIMVSQTRCQIPPGATTCTVLVSWHSSTTDAKIYRYNNSGGQPVLLGSGLTGEVSQSLTSGANVYFAMVKGSVRVFRSPDVTAYAQAGPLAEIDPVLPSVPPYVNPTSAVGYTGGEFRVDEGGSATYQIPIFAPKGRGNLTPAFSIGYNSGAGDSLMGLGWNLSGVSAIARCRFTVETDGHNQRMGDSASTHGFCLDGQRLVKINAVANGQLGAEYRTEVDSFQKIVVTGHEPYLSGWQPTAFTVYGKDGSVRTFGAGTSQRRRTNGTASYVVEWWESSRSDTTSNTISFSYLGDPATGSFVLDQANYVGGRITFQYGNRPYPSVTYYNKLKLTQNKRLERINVYAADQAQELRHYGLTYEAVPLNSALSRLAMIEECAGSSCLESTVLEWYDQPQAAQADLDFYGGTNNFQDLQTFKLGDVNGDGMADVVWVSGNSDSSDQLKITFSKARGISEPGESGAPDPLGSGGQGFSIPVTVTGVLGEDEEVGRTWGLLDYNADGLEDLVILQGDTGAEWQVWLSNGTTFLDSGISVPNSGTNAVDRPEMLIADFSGDGLPDMLVFSGRNEPNGPVVHAWIMERDTNGQPGRPYRFSARYAVQMQGSPCGSVAFPEFDVTRSETLDVNADGQSDLMLRSDPCNFEITPIDPPVEGSFAGGEVPLPTNDVNWITLSEWSATRATSSPTGATSGSIAIFQLDSIDPGVNGAGGTLKLKLMETNWPENVNLNSFRLVDINGDSYADAIWNLPDSQNWKYSLNSGAGFENAQCVLGNQYPNCDSGAGSTYAVQIADFNGDGRLDFWVRRDANTGENHRYDVHIWDGDGFDPTPIQTEHESGGIPWVRSTADLDGDGYPDTLRIRVDGSDSWKLQRSRKHHQPRNVLKSISQGLGAVTQIDYAPTTFKSVYGRSYSGSAITSGRGSPVLDVLAPRFVVSRVISSAPTASNGSNRAEIRYRYEGMRVQGGGRGSLGFQRVYTLAGAPDASQDLETITEYYQGFPLTGVPKSTRLIMNGTWSNTCGTATQPDPGAAGCLSYGEYSPPFGRTVLNQTDDEWHWRYAGSATVDPILQYSPILVEKKVSTITKKGLDGTLLSKSVSTLVYDDYGNATSSSAENYANEAGSTLLRSIQTSNQYLNDTVHWFLGRLTSSTVTTTRYNGSQTLVDSRSSAFDYDPATGLLVKEVIQPNGSSTQKLSTFYALDAYGNQLYKRTCSGDVADTVCKALTSSSILFHSSSNSVQRYVRTQMDANGIFPIKTFEPFRSPGIAVNQPGAIEKMVSHVTRDAYGNPTQTTGVNGGIELAAYDAFGRLRFAGNSAGASSTTTRSWCGTACPSFGGGAAYVLIQSPAGGAKAWTYFDRLDREMLVVTEAFGTSQYSAVRKTYDEQGRVKSVSEPYYTFSPSSSQVGNPSGGSIRYTTTYYDALGRVEKIGHPNGTSTDIEFSGLTTTTTLPENEGEGGGTGFRETKIQVQNLLGEIEEVRDHYGTKLQYSFDAHGNITLTKRVVSGTGPLETTAVFDSLGRRTSLNDADTGTWTTQYNAAGEAVIEKSGQTCSASLYDARGRVWSRSDYNNTSCSGTAETVSTWNFDSSPNGAGQLDFVTSSDGNVSGVTPLNYERTEIHDAIGRVKRIETRIGSTTYVERSTFDAVGRPRQVFFSGSGILESGELLEYDSKGFPTIVRDVMDGASGRIYHEVTQRNARGQVTEERRADNPNLVTTRIYEADTGWLNNIITPNLQNLAYGHDALGNVSERIDASPGSDIHERFTYDGLQRLTGTKYFAPNGSLRTTVGYTYDALGNRKPTVGSATYGTKASYCTAAGERTPGSGALSVLNGTQYCYDGRGNRVRAVASNGVVQQTVAYTAYGQAREVKSTVSGSQGHVTRYYYGPERQRIRRMDFYSATPTGSADVADQVGNAEIITRLGSATRELRRSLGPVILSRMINGGGVVIGSAERYLFTDAQGSPHRITRADGTLLANEGSRWFSAFGARAETADGDELTLIQLLNTATDQVTRQSYTGHEAADAVGLIHMGGRMYDPLSGRFLQPDPIVQDPSNPQNFNRYTYVFNNPLAWTDPTGYWGAREQGALRTVAAIVIAIYTGVYVNAGVTAGTLSTTQAAAISAAGGAAAGAVQTGTLRGALVGAFSAYVGYQIGNAFVGQEGSFGHVAAHATLGGVTSTLNGGKFGHGFIAAGFSSALAPQINTGNDFSDGFLHAMVGGTASRLSGGKFANGAVTAAFSFAVGRGVAGGASDKSPDTKLETAIDAYARQSSSTDYLVAFESSPYLRATVPGQVSWDNAITSWEKGSYGYAAAFAGSMLAEQAMFVATLGQSFTANAVATSGYVTVSRWGRSGLEAGDWVMKGNVTWLNYIRSGKWDPGPWNQVAPYSTGQSFVVPSAHVAMPATEGFSGALKGWLLGQRQYLPKP